MRRPRQGGVAAGRVDDHEVGLGRAPRPSPRPGRPGRRRRRRQLGQRRPADLDGIGSTAPLERAPGAPAGEEMRHRLLAQIEIDHRHPGAVVQQGGDEMDGDGRLARPALLVADHDDARLTPPLASTDRENQLRLAAAEHTRAARGVNATRGRIRARWRRRFAMRPPGLSERAMTVHSPCPSSAPSPPCAPGRRLARGRRARRPGPDHGRPARGPPVAGAAGAGRRPTASSPACSSTRPSSRRTRTSRPIRATRPRDAALLAGAGCDLLYAPTRRRDVSAGLFAPRSPSPGVSAPHGRRSARPHHFAGVATVVAKLLDPVRARTSRCSARRTTSSCW